MALQVCDNWPGMLLGAGTRQEVAKVGQSSAEGFSRDHPGSTTLWEGCAGTSLSPIHDRFYTFPTKQLN